MTGTKKTHKEYQREAAALSRIAGRAEEQTIRQRWAAFAEILLRHDYDEREVEAILAWLDKNATPYQLRAALAAAQV
ncbi:MAG TPA: hypothetical protein VN908_07180 [Gemmatimonadales bacterium]|nr:hypothetical protein [Gemmatimonadales bacterium]